MNQRARRFFKETYLTNLALGYENKIILISFIETVWYFLRPICCGSNFDSGELY